MTVSVRPIMHGDTAAVAQFLHDHLNDGISMRSWADSLGVNRMASAPNHGFLLEDRGRVVGAYVAHYMDRDLGRGTERFCNLGAWCVIPEFGFHALRLLKALLAQDGYHFLDLSPSGNVVAINERLGFHHLDTRTALLVTKPWGRHGVSDDPGVIERTLGERERRLYLDHRDLDAAYHLVLRREAEHCYVVFRKDRRKRLPRVFASMLHVGNPDLFHRMLRPLCGHLLLHGIAAMLAELRIVGHRPAGSIILASSRPKMYRSSTLQPADIDYFYSELVSVSW